MRGGWLLGGEARRAILKNGFRVLREGPCDELASNSFHRAGIAPLVAPVNCHDNVVL